MVYKTGRIMKGIGGFYTVAVDSAMITCRARGKFRLDEITPMAGDFAEISLSGDGTGYIQKILPRKNELARPPVANVDLLIVVVSKAPPETDFFLVDKITAVSLNRSITPVVCLNKTDQDLGQEFRSIYEKAGFYVVSVSARTGEGMAGLIAALGTGLSVFAGNSGVGKTSLLNRLSPDLSHPTGMISKKIARGKHTTRQVEIIRLPSGALLADTPGFSFMDIEKSDTILKEDLQYLFPEFKPYIGQCRFTGCSHTKEMGCAVCKAVIEGAIPDSRHKSYIKLYEQAKAIKEWEIK